MMSLSTGGADSREFIKNAAFFNRIGFFPTIRPVPLYGMVQVQWQMARPHMGDDDDDDDDYDPSSAQAPHVLSC